jgi:hypothetical protein
MRGNPSTISKELAIDSDNDDANPKACCARPNIEEA